MMPKRRISDPFIKDPANVLWPFKNGSKGERDDYNFADKSVTGSPC